MTVEGEELFREMTEPLQVGIRKREVELVNKASSGIFIEQISGRSSVGPYGFDRISNCWRFTLPSPIPAELYWRGIVCHEAFPLWRSRPTFGSWPELWNDKRGIEIKMP